MFYVGAASGFDLDLYRKTHLDKGITMVILIAVKTAISIPNETFEAAEQYARRLGLSRSELYATAVAEYLARHRAAGIRERLDAVYEIDDEAARLDAVMTHVQLDSAPGEDW